MININFKIEKNDFITANDLIYTNSRIRIIFYSIIIIFFILDMIFPSNNTNVMFWFLMLIFIGLFDYIIISNIKKSKNKKRFVKYEKYLEGPYKVSLIDTGIRYEWNKNILELEWNEVIKTYSNKSIIVFISLHNTIHILPKRNINEEFMMILRNKLLKIVI